ncbi:phage tail protein [Rhizobium rhizogenes]|uniref:phage tail protein n=1 Tax=Rhizobium rhizogenes TaxID=359 RepID=UPI0024BDB714|nr:phage tail protein [Rhizobium rhizogenes]MDJ1632240.1 phage tail protein [Rhizobium rhizogenes]
MQIIRILCIAAWFLLATISFAHADPITAAIGAIASTIGQLGIVAKLVLGIALNVGASLLQRALTKNQNTTQSGIRTDVASGGDNSLAFIVGTYATAGSHEYVGSWGNAGKTPNAYLTQVRTLSDLPISGITNRIWINSEACTVDTSDTSYGAQGFPVTEFKTNGNNNHFWVKVPTGTQTTADSFLLAKFGSDPDRPWLSDMIGRGVAMAIFTAQFDRELFTSTPSPIFEVQGIPLYDPRKDSTVGGSGAHRWGQPGTYEFSDNNVVITYNILRGIYYDGALIYGPAVPASRLPLSNWFAAMNECDRLINLDGGGTEKQFRAGYEIQTADKQPVDVIDDILLGCNGRMAEIGGVYKIHVGAPALPVYFFTDDDIIVTDGQTFDPFPGYESTYNGASASYPEPEAGWQMKDAPQYSDATFLAADGGEGRLASLTFNATPFPVQVQRLMRSVTNDNRNFRRHQFLLPPEVWLFEPLDTFSWSSDRNGYVAKQFLNTGMDDLDNANQSVALLETDPADYDWSPTFQLPWTVGPLSPRLPTAQPMTGWQVQPAILYDATGRARRPSIEVFYDGDQIDVRAVRVQVQLAESGVVVFDGEVPYGDPATNANPSSVILNGIFLPNEDYLARGEFVPFSGRQAEWSAWLAVTTPNVLLGDADVYLPGVVDDLHEFVGEATEWIRDGARQALLDAQRLARTTADQDFGNFTDRQTIRTDVVSQLQTAVSQVTASYMLAIDVATGPSSAIAQQLTTLSASITSLQTGQTANSQAITLLVASVDTINGQLTAQANSITSLTAQVNDVSASATFRMSVYASPSGYSSRIGMEARGGSGDTYRSASAFLDVPSSTSSPTRFAVVADQFSVTNGSNYQNPFIFQSGVAYLNSIKVNWADIVNASISSAQIQDAAITNAKIADAAITNAKIGNLQVTTSNLDFNQITDTASNNRTGNGVAGGETDLGARWTIANPNPNPVLTSIQWTIQVTSNTTTYVKLMDFTTGSELARLSVTGTGSGTQTNSGQVMIIEPRPGSAGTYQYGFVVYSGAVNVNATVTQLWWKR